MAITWSTTGGRYIPSGMQPTDPDTANILRAIAGIYSELPLVVHPGTTDVENATNVRAAYTAAKELSPSATNRIRLVVLPGRYDFETTPLVRDTEFIDWYCPGKAIFTSQVSVANHATVEDTVADIQTENIDFEIDSAYAAVAYDGTDPAAYYPPTTAMVTGDTYSTIANANEIRVPAASRTGNNIYASIVDNGGGASWKVNLYKESARTTLIGHTANFTGNGRQDIIADGDSGIVGYIHIRNYAPIPTGEHTALAIAANTGITIRVAGRGRFTNCEWRSLDETKAWSNRVAADYNGEYRFCKAGRYGFGLASGTFDWCTADDAGFDGACGTFRFCYGGNYSFGGLGDASGTFIGCEGGNYAFGYAAFGRFEFCKGGSYAFGGEHGADGVFLECIGGSGSFGDDYCAGLYRNCIGGAGSFGGTAADSNGGFFGTCIDCIGGASSFGLIDNNASTGTLIRCKLGSLAGNVLTIGVTPGNSGLFTGYAEGCDFQVAANSAKAIVVGDGAKLHNCTFRSTGVGGEAISGGTSGDHVSAEIVHCRTKGIFGSYIDNTCATPYNVVIS